MGPRPGETPGAQRVRDGVSGPQVGRGPHPGTGVSASGRAAPAGSGAGPGASACCRGPGVDSLAPQPPRFRGRAGRPLKTRMAATPSRELRPGACGEVPAQGPHTQAGSREGRRAVNDGASEVGQLMRFACQLPWPWRRPGPALSAAHHAPRPSSARAGQTGPGTRTHGDPEVGEVAGTSRAELRFCWCTGLAPSPHGQEVGGHDGGVGTAAKIRNRNPSPSRVTMVDCLPSPLLGLSVPPIKWHRRPSWLSD